MSWHLWTVTTSQAKLVLDVWRLSFFFLPKRCFRWWCCVVPRKTFLSKKTRQNSRIHCWCVHIFQAIFCQTFFMLLKSCKMYKTMSNQQQHCSFRFWRLLWDWWSCFCHLSSRHFFGTTCQCFHVCSWEPPCYINHTKVESMTATATKWEIDIQRHLPTWSV